MADRVFCGLFYFHERLRIQSFLSLVCTSGVPGGQFTLLLWVQGEACTVTGEDCPIPQKVITTYVDKSKV